MRLPTLESASIDQLLDFKKEMQGPLNSFRKAIYIFSESVNSHPWDKDFEYDCLKIYSKEIAPVVEELNTLASQTSVLKNMGRRVLKDEDFRRNTAWMVGGLAVKLSSSSNLFGALESIYKLIVSMSMIVIAPKAYSAFMKTMNIRADAKDDIESIKKEMKSNSIYYYYKAYSGL